MSKTRELPTEIWDFLFFASNGGLTGSDKVVISRSSPVFEAVLRRKLLEECVTHLIHVVAPYLSKRDLLMLRHTCKGLKQRVDEFEENRFGSNILASLKFVDDDQRWNDLAGMIENQTGKGTLGRWLFLAVEPEMKLEDDKAADFFKKCGHRIVNLKLRVAMDSAKSLRYRLLHYLKYCRNLRRLQLFADILSTDLNHSERLVDLVLFNRVLGERPPDPIELPFLTELQMCSRILKTDENGENRIQFYELDFDLFFETIFCSRLGKLTKMGISDTFLYLPLRFILRFMPSPSFVTEFNTAFMSLGSVGTLRDLQSKGATLKKLTLVDKSDHLATNFDECKAELANYLQEAVSLRTLSLHLEMRVALFEDFPPPETEFNSSVRSLILRNVIFPDGKGLQNLGFKFQSLYKLHLSYDELENEENYDFIPDTNHIFEHVPNLRQVSLKSCNTPTVYSINHHQPT